MGQFMTQTIPWQTFIQNEIRLRGCMGFTRALVKNSLHASLFTARRLLRQTRRAEYLRCRTIEEYLAFAITEFRPEQHREEILGFLRLAAEEAPRTVCEIGTRYGGTNFLLSQALPSVSLMIGIDLYVRSSAKLRHYRRPTQELLFIHGSSYVPETVEQVRKAVEARQIDLLFIDGDHRYPGVRSDFLAYRHLVREGGLIAFHDIVPHQGKSDGSIPPNPFIEVPQFWSRIKELYPSHEFVRDASQDYYGIGAIRYSAAVAVPADL
jgi:cephalosporin hydroxylase